MSGFTIPIRIVRNDADQPDEIDQARAFFFAEAHARLYGIGEYTVAPPRFTFRDVPDPWTRVFRGGGE